MRAPRKSVAMKKIDTFSSLRSKEKTEILNDRNFYTSTWRWLNISVVSLTGVRRRRHVFEMFRLSLLRRLQHLLPRSVALERVRVREMSHLISGMRRQNASRDQPLPPSPHPASIHSCHAAMTTPVPDGSSPSCVAGTQSSPSIPSPSRRDRQRSTSPSERRPFHALLPRPGKHEVQQTVIPPFVVKQYLAIESAVPLKDGQVVPGALGESAEREAGYLLDDGSLLARDQVRDYLGGAQQPRKDDGKEVQWRSVPLRITTMEGTLS